MIHFDQKFWLVFMNFHAMYLNILFCVLVVKMRGVTIFIILVLISGSYKTDPAKKNNSLIVFRFFCSLLHRVIGLLCCC